jgi:hypothetical protein
LTSSTDIPLKSSDSGPIPPPEPRPLIHPLSAALLIAVDGLWTLADWAVLAWAVTIPLSFLAAGIPTYLIQKHVSGDSGGRSLAVGTFLGVLAAVPTPVTGTVVGGIVLAMAGLRSLRRLLWQ